MLVLTGNFFSKTMAGKELNANYNLCGGNVNDLDKKIDRNDRILKTCMYTIENC